jgi:hypothetical protein
MSDSRIKRVEEDDPPRLANHRKVSFYCRTTGESLAHVVTRKDNGLSTIYTPGLHGVSPSTAKLYALAVELAVREVIT